MGRTYKWDTNPFQDFLFASMLYGTDIAKKELEVDVYVGFVTILEYFVPNKVDSQYLDYEIINKDGHYKVIGKNILSALWLSGIFPKNPKHVLDTNEFILEDIKYKFNPKTKKLTYRLIKK